MREFEQLANSGKKIELGQKGEQIAADYLQKRGYRILNRNYRVGHSDIDILATKGEYLIFAEVRTKSGDNNGMPEDTLTKKKLNRMKKTAEMYIVFNHYEGLARLDAVCIILDNSGTIMHLEHYKNVG